MIKRWSTFNETFKRGEKISAKVDLLLDLSIELKDLGLSVDIWNGTWKDNGGFGTGAQYDLPSKSIIMLIEDETSVLDDNNYYENELKDKTEIIEFQKRLNDFGFKPFKSGFSDKVYFLFPKTGLIDKDLLKGYRKTNESSDDLKKQLSDKLMEVREVFTEFEDIGIINYSISASGYESIGYVQFDPKRGDFERFIDMVTPTVKFGLSEQAVGKVRISQKDFCIIADIKLLGEPNAHGSTIIGTEGIKVLEDILIANSRLIDAGCDVKLDLNASHNAYKPIKFLIYFDLDQTR